MPDFDGVLFCDFPLADDHRARDRIRSRIVLESGIPIQKNLLLARAGRRIHNRDVVELRNARPKLRESPGIGFEGDDLSGHGSHLFRVQADVSA